MLYEDYKKLLTRMELTGKVNDQERDYQDLLRLLRSTKTPTVTINKK